MPRPAVARQYGRKTTRTKAHRLFAELPQSPIRKQTRQTDADGVDEITQKVAGVKLNEEKPLRRSPRKSVRAENVVSASDTDIEATTAENNTAKDLALGESTSKLSRKSPAIEGIGPPGVSSGALKDETKFGQEIEQVETHEAEESQASILEDDNLYHMTWEELCPSDSKIVKIAEASYAEVYRITNAQGTSIIKVIRLESPIRPQTKQQIKAGLIDEEPRSESDVQGELQISELLAGVPGFVIYKERYVVLGKTTKGLLETHQTYQRRMKRQDPGRAQFYPSPSRYLDETKFLVVELGDAGSALEDWKITTESQLWDIFFLEAIALARAEIECHFEHRDLHEGNICLKQVNAPNDKPSDADTHFGYSGLDITILDYGLSRAENLYVEPSEPVAFDLEKDLSLFTSTHAPQCKVYRQMRSRFLGEIRGCLPPQEHTTPYAKGKLEAPLSWEAYEPYTNVLWLAYLYQYLVKNFSGDKKEVRSFRATTVKLWAQLNPNAGDDVPLLDCAQDVVDLAVEEGWIRPDQIVDGDSVLREESIILFKQDAEDDGDVKRSPRQRTTRGS